MTAQRGDRAGEVHVGFSPAAQVQAQPHVALAEPAQAVDAGNNLEEVVAGWQHATRQAKDGLIATRRAFAQPGGEHVVGAEQIRAIASHDVEAQQQVAHRLQDVVV